MCGIYMGPFFFSLFLFFHLTSAPAHETDVGGLQGLAGPSYTYTTDT